MISRNQNNIWQQCQHYKRFFKEFCAQKIKAIKTMKGQAVAKNKRRKEEESEVSIDWPAHNQTLTKQKQLNDRNQYIPINANTEC
jgi:hypothetical protein